jgi:hypothetical protein
MEADVPTAFDRPNGQPACIGSVGLVVNCPIVYRFL